MLGELADDRHIHEALGAVDELRMLFIANLPVPEHALMYGRSLRDRLQQQLALVDEAAGRLRSSATLQATMNDDKSLAGKHAAYWAEIEDGMDDEEFRAKPKEDPYARPNVSMQLP